MAATTCLYLLSCAYVVAAGANNVRIFEATFLNACFWLDFSPPMIGYYASLSEALCAIRCSLNSLCYVYHVNSINKTCTLYPIITWSQVVNKSFVQPGVCRTGIDTNWVNQVQHSSQLFTSSGTFVVPTGISSLLVVAVGGGGGAYYTNSGGGGSGYVTYMNITVVPASTFTVTVGAGGLGSNASSSAATSGSASSFGDLVIASGGQASVDRFGGNGGSGGGSAASFNSTSGNGGSCGSNGTASKDNLPGGMGQGSSFSNWFSFMKYATFSCGAAGSVGTPLLNSTSVVGGGGGGGLMINGRGLQGGGNLSCGSIRGPRGALGYGAGGSSSCLIAPYPFGTYTVNGVVYRGGCGAAGVVYVEY